VGGGERRPGLKTGKTLVTRPKGAPKTLGNLSTSTVGVGGERGERAFNLRENGEREPGAGLPL